MKLYQLALIISGLAFYSIGTTMATITLDDLKTELQTRETPSLEIKDYKDVDFKTRKEKKFEKRKISSMSKKFGPLAMGVKINNTSNSNVNFGLDLVEAYEIFNQKKNLQDFYAAFQPDKDYTIFGPELRTEIRSILDKVINTKDPSTKAI